MRALAALLVLVALAAVGCGGRAAVSEPLVVDTDLSTDDVVALSYLANDPHVRLAAVTVSGTGLVECPQGARNAAALLAALGRGDVPVACGRTSPLAGGNTLPESWRRGADAMFGLELPPAPAAIRPSAGQLLAATVEHAPRAPTILELAPMTNVAQLLLAHPELAAKVHRIVAMGGALSVPGNAPDDRAAEVNIWADPEAARAVLASGVPTTLVPLDATNQVPVTTFVGTALKRFHHEAAPATIVWDLVRETGMDRGGTYFWDPLAAVVVTHPDLVPATTRRVAVSAAGRTTVARAGARIRVATRVDRRAFERELLSTLLQGRRFVVPPAHPDATITYDAARCSYDGPGSVLAGPVTIDSTNRSGVPFQWLAGHLDARHTLADLKRYARGLRPPNAQPPPWFTVDAGGETPPRSTMTWVVPFPLSTTGTSVLACATASPPAASIVATVAVFGQG